jgi:hypothetical protein
MTDISRLARTATAFLHAPVAAALLAALPASPSLAGGPLKDVPLETQCLKQLIESRAPEIDCVHQAWFTTEERDDLAKLTRGYLLDASCAITVKIARQEIDTALAAADAVFTSPAQPMTCELETSRGKLTVGGTFAPRVVFKGGVAVEATPGLGGITGVNSYLAWPVVHYINYSERITKPMMLMINAYRAHRAPLPRP